MPINKQQKLLDIENLTVQTPSGATLVRDLSLVINNNEHLLVSSFFYAEFFMSSLDKVLKCDPVEAEQLFWYMNLLTGDRT